MKKRTTTKLEIRKNKASPFYVSFYEKGKRAYQSFKTRLEADAFAKAIEKKNKLPADMDMTTLDLLEFAKFRALCRDCKISVEEGFSEVYDFIVGKHKVPQDGITISEGIRLFLQSRQKTNSREGTIQDYQSYTPWITNYFGDTRPISSITPEDLMRLVQTRDKVNVRQRFAGKLRTIFRYFYTSGIIKNKFPVELITIEKIKTDEKPPCILSVDDAKLLFASLPQEPTVLAAFALGAFAGMRPEEICTDSSKKVIAWEDVNIKSRIITLSGKTSKVRRIRQLNGLPDNLWSFLELTPPEERHGAICKKTYGQLRVIRQKLPLKLGRDILRHSFGSYAYYKMDPKIVVLMMGHLREFKTFEKHYMGLASKETAEEYFSILPISKNSVAAKC